MADSPKPTLIAQGARALVSFSGGNGNIQPFALLTGADLFDGLTHEAIKVLGKLPTALHVPTDYNASLRANRVYVIGDSLSRMGIFPDMGSTDEEFLTNVLNFGDMDVIIQDVTGIKNGKTGFWKAEGVRASTRAKSIEPGRTVYENIDFVVRIVRELGDSAM